MQGREVTCRTATKEMKLYPRDNQTLLTLPFQPIAIVCQLPMRVMGAFSFSGDLCSLDYKERTRTEDRGACQAQKVEKTI